MSQKKINNLPPRIAVQFTSSDYSLIKNIASKQDESLSGVVRNLCKQSLNLKVYEENCDMLCRIIRQEIKNSQRSDFDRILSMLSKTVIMSATATFLNAETINSFVPIENQQEVKTAYEKARIKGVEYLKTQINLEK